jgi:hypothetical protein
VAVTAVAAAEEADSTAAVAVTAEDFTEPSADRAAEALPLGSVDRAELWEVFAAATMPLTVTDTMLQVAVRTVPATGRLIAPIIRAIARIEAGATVLIITDIGHTGGATAPTGGDHIPGGRTTRGGVTPTGGDRLTILTGRPMDTTETGAIRE